MERNLLSVPTIEVDLKRYEELLRKEAMLDRIEKQYDVELFLSKKAACIMGVKSNDSK